MSKLNISSVFHRLIVPSSSQFFSNEILWWIFNGVTLTWAPNTDGTKRSNFAEFREYDIRQRRRNHTWPVEWGRCRSPLIEGHTGDGWKAGNLSTVIISSLNVLFWTPFSANISPTFGAYVSAIHRQQALSVGIVPACTPWVKKACHPNHGYNFVNSW